MAAPRHILTGIMRARREAIGQGIVGLGRRRAQGGAVEITYAPDYAGLTRYQHNSKQLATQISTGSPVSSWDEVAQGLTATQGVTSQQPLFQDVAGYPAVTFGGDDRLIAPSTSVLTGSGLTVFLVVEFLSWPQFGGPLAFKRATGDDDLVQFYLSNSDTDLIALTNRGTVDDVNFYRSTQTLVGAGRTILAAEFVNLLPDTRGLYRDGVLIDGIPQNRDNRPLAPAEQHSTYHLGVGFGNVPGNVNLYDVVYYTGGALTLAQLDEVTTHLKSEWGIA